MTALSRKLLIGLALGAFVISVIVVRVLVSGYRELNQARQAIAADSRLLHLGRAARFYVPFTPFYQEALNDLQRIGRANGPGSLQAWQEVRSALLATRSFYTPHPDWLEEANREIANRMAAQEDSGRGVLAARIEWHLARLRQSDAPSVGFSLLALCGLGVWIFSGLRFFDRAAREQAGLPGRIALLYGLAVFAGLVMFFVGLAYA